MPQLISEDSWEPVGVDDLEPNAHDVVRSTDNKLVVAGPGAGKTELLAQRANYILTTGICPKQKRILAISFKRDAAKNLSERVKARSGEFSERFDSFTLDSFAKQLVDRFYPAIPAEWRPRPNYLVRTTSIPEQSARAWFNQAFVPIGHSRPRMEVRSKTQIAADIDKIMHGAQLPYEIETTAIHKAWGCQWWVEQLALPSTEPSLTFPMLNRLAAYLLRINPNIIRALRMTYSHVFLDEFQDTTASQWDLIASAFAGSDCVVTAVGDVKQRIMTWAGADENIFEKFKSEFNAKPLALIRNYRSVSELIGIQHVIAQAVEKNTILPESASSHQGKGICSILGFETPEAEALYLADFIYGKIEAGANPRDFCILARQATGVMIAQLQKELRARGVTLQDESFLQDLRVEPVTNIVLLALRLAISTRDATAWCDLTSELSILSGLSDESNSIELEKLVINHKNWVSNCIQKNLDITGIVEGIVSLIGVERYRACYRQYMNGNYLEKVIQDLSAALTHSLDNAGSIEALVADFIGENNIPAMSIHKSKGLEFKIVIFMGLEDEQWWNFRAQPEEEKRAFFVAFSRAINSVFFTFSHQRPKWGRPAQTNREQVGDLFNILTEAGVELINK
ncbi:MAG: ATP-dependent helicase [Pseudomonadota bacterium]